MDAAFLPKGVVNFVVEGVLGDLQAATSRNLRCADGPAVAADDMLAGMTHPLLLPRVVLPGGLLQSRESILDAPSGHLNPVHPPMHVSPLTACSALTTGMTLELAPCKPSKKKASGDGGDGTIEQIENVGVSGRVAGCLAGQAAPAWLAVPPPPPHPQQAVNFRPHTSTH